MLKTLRESPETATAQQIEVRYQRFSVLQENIEANDRLLNTTLLELDHRDEHIEQLLHERHALIEELINLNKTVTVQAQAVKSLIGDEIRKATNGHTAIKGYRTPEQQRNSGSFRNAM
ncbi:hypothetical protein [Desulfopila aestuarii]|nr:hypothetical protein [Desulfopila aestuarii]